MINRFLWQAVGWSLLGFAVVNLTAAAFEFCCRTIQVPMFPFNVMFELSRLWLCGLALAGWRNIC